MADTRLKHFVTLWLIPLERALREHLPPPGAHSPDILREIERVLFPGKQRLAGLTVLAAGRAVGGDAERLLPTASAFEYLANAIQPGIDAAASSVLSEHAESLIYAHAGLKLVDVVEGLSLGGDLTQTRLLSAAMVTGAKLCEPAPAQLEAVIEISLLAAHLGDIPSEAILSNDRLRGALDDPEILAELFDLRRALCD